MSETTKFDDLPAEEQQRVRDLWAQETEAKLEDWEEKIASATEERIFKKLGPSMNALSQHSGMSALTQGLDPEVAKIVQETWKDESPEAVLAASQNPALLETIQNSARYKHQEAKAAEDPPKDEAPKEDPPKEPVAEAPKEGDPPPEAPKQEEPVEELTAEQQEAGEWAKKNLGVELSQKDLETAITTVNLEDLNGVRRA